jgi:GT2 family glycosyltransferase
MPPATVSILIVTYNSRAVLSACLASIAAETRLPYEIIMVDNVSQDDTITLVRTHYPQIVLIRNKRNVGFAVAVNQASQMARGGYLLLLNPDTLVHEGAVDRLVAYLDSHPAVGICAPRVLAADGHIRHNCFAFETPWSMFWFGVGVGPLRRLRDWMLRRNRWDITAAAPQVVEAVTGAAMLVRRELFERLGGLDERFFMYCEDGDFCLRARRAGWRTMLVPDAVVTHFGGASTPHAVALLNGMIGRHLVSSRYLYTQKYWEKGAMWALRWAYGIVGLLFLLVSRFIPNAAQRHQLAIVGRLLLCTPAPISRNAAAHQPSGGWS